MISTLAISAALMTATPNLGLMSLQEPSVAAPAPVPTPAPNVAPPTDSFPILAPGVEAPGCAGLLGSPAYCLSTNLTEIGALAERYIAKMETLGWLPAGGDDNRVIFVRRTDRGVCDGMQMIAFYDESKPVVPTTVGYLGFAVIPGNICVAPPAQDPVQPQ